VGYPISRYRRLNFKILDVTGSKTAIKGIVDIYDIFGPAPQTLQGADLLAAALDALVIVPDFFKGKPAQNEWFSNPSEENDKLKANFQKGSRDFEAHGKVLLPLVEEAKAKWSSVTSWGAFGLCWGGKVCRPSVFSGSFYRRLCRPLVSWSRTRNR
jgi:dienelactone hydrolase